MNDKRRQDAQRRYEEARALRTKLQRLADTKAPGWRNMEHALREAVETENYWLGQIIDPVENGSIEERERLERH